MKKTSMIFGILFSIVVITTAYSDEVVIQPDSSTGKDAYLHMQPGSPTYLYGSQPSDYYMKVWATSGNIDKGLIQFQLPNNIEANSLTNATMSLYYFGSSSSFLSADINVNRLTSDWNEGPNGIINTIPSSDDLYMATTNVFRTPQEVWVNWDITNMCRGWLSADIPNYGAMISTPYLGATNNNTFWFYSSEDVPAFHPKLTLTYNGVPEPTVPEPCTMVLFGIGGAGMAMLKRKKK